MAVNVKFSFEGLLDTKQDTPITRNGKRSRVHSDGSAEIIPVFSNSFRVTMTLIRQTQTEWRANSKPSSVGRIGSYSIPLRFRQVPYCFPMCALERHKIPSRAQVNVHYVQ